MNLENPEKDSQLSNLIREGIDQTSDMLTVLLQYFHLKRQNATLIDDCKLSMEKAILRCQTVYHFEGGSCSVVTINGKKAPFVSIACPNGFQRFGCCKCVRSCSFQNLVDEDFGKSNTWHLKCKKVNRKISNIVEKYQWVKLP
jgi:hypothetical protein